MKKTKFKIIKEKGKVGLFLTLTTLFVVIGVFLIGFTKWSLTTFGKIDFEQFLFTVFGPNAGTPKETYIQIAKALGVVGLLIVALIFCSYVFVRFTLAYAKESEEMQAIIPMRLRKGLVLACAFAVFGVSLYYTDSRMGIREYVFQESSNFIEDHYEQPKMETLDFPENKKNLVYIYLESFESTYFSKELGGNIDTNLLPELTTLMEEKNAINFSHQDQFGGSRQLYGSTYSIAGMFSQQSGLPFKVPGDGNKFGEAYNFIPGAITLGDVLKNEGYARQFLVGADGSFAGVNNFYRTHGEFNVLDHKIAIEEGKLPEDYNVWWGFEDRKLFDFAKGYLEEMSQQAEPFALIVEADDTHFPDGFTDPGCPQPSDKPYENSIQCVDAMVSEFIRYIEAQPYAKDTVIVVVGDHLSMEKNYFTTLDQGYERTVFNAMFNVDPDLQSQAKNKNREFAAIDMYPTILRALNVDLNTSRMGLGTDLFSGEQTLIEEYGFQHVHDELGKKSDFFKDTFLMKPQIEQ